MVKNNHKEIENLHWNNEDGVIGSKDSMIHSEIKNPIYSGSRYTGHQVDGTGKLGELEKNGYNTC
jgi:hypothetical protein